MSRPRTTRPKRTVATSKKCTVCNRTKRLGLFYKVKSNKDGYANRCKSCTRKSTTRRNQRSTLVAKYGITLAEFDAMLAHQDGKCYICHMNQGKKHLSIDHDHATGEVRGLLCQPCNRFLGRISDRPEAGIRVTTYLMNPPARDVLPERDWSQFEDPRRSAQD